MIIVYVIKTTRAATQYVFKDLDESVSPSLMTVQEVSRDCKIELRLINIISN